MDGVTETKAEALPKEGMHDGDGGDAKGGHGRGADTAKGRHVRCGRRRRRYCQRKACAMWTETETAPVEGVAETVALPIGGMCDRDGGTAKGWRDGDGEDADGRRDGG